MTQEFFIGQIFEGEYPPEAAEWCNERGDCYIAEIESIVKEVAPEDIVGEDEEGNSIPGTGVIRRFEIKEIPPETEEEIKQRRIEEIKSQLNAIDVKRIRAMLEPSVKDETTGETWLEYYNAQVFALRDELNSLE